ncbi:hypothetical protein BDY24DRAFT_411589 [Mrakia frigida]|uniref:zinc finger MYND domain-containing protein n=1 Tax=Mrakia frigida TaxID=29902 RepID=UPI003FCBF630
MELAGSEGAGASYILYILSDVPSIDERRSFCEEFTAQYMPSFIQTFLSLEGQAKTLLFSPLVRSVLLLADSSFARFVRLFPKEACDFYLAILDLLADGTLGLQLMKETATGVSYRLPLYLYLFIIVLLSQVAQQLPPDMNLPSLPHRLQRGLHAFATSCKADPQIPYSIGIMSMYAVAEGATDPLDVTGIDRLSATLVWSACEWEVGRRADARGHEEGVASCVEIKGGEHMLACSRCLAVRYCCKDHQRADWKRHKRFCFQPTW